VAVSSSESYANSSMQSLLSNVLCVQSPMHLLCFSVNLLFCLAAVGCSLQ